MSKVNLRKEEKALLGLVQVLFPDVKFVRRSTEWTESITFCDKRGLAVFSYSNSEKTKAFEEIPFGEMFTLAELLDNEPVGNPD